MTARTGRLSPASDVQSVARLNGCRPKTIGTAPQQSRCSEHQVRGRADTTTVAGSKGADMAKRTRIPGQTDSRTQDSTVKITPVSSEGPAASTTRVA